VKPKKNFFGKRGCTLYTILVFIRRDFSSLDVLFVAKKELVIN